MSAKVFQLSKFETRTAERCSQELKGFEYKTSEDWQAEFYKQGNGLELWENILALSRTCIVALSFNQQLLNMPSISKIFVDILPMDH